MDHSFTFLKGIWWCLSKGTYVKHQTTDSAQEAIICKTSLVVQWLRLGAFNAGDLGLIPGRASRCSWKKQTNKKGKWPFSLLFHKANRNQKMGAHRTTDAYFPACLLEHPILVPAAQWLTYSVGSVPVNWLRLVETVHPPICSCFSGAILKINK